MKNKMREYDNVITYFRIIPYLDKDVSVLLDFLTLNKMRYTNSVPVTWS